MDLSKGAKIAVKQCMNIQPTERVLIITDRNMQKQIPLSIEKVCKQIKAKVEFIEIEPLKRKEEPKDEIAKLMKEFDAEFLITSKSLSHTNARRNASKSGVRIASMPGIAKFSFTDGGLTADYQKVKKLCVKMWNKIKNVENIEIKSNTGTDLQLKIGDYLLDIDEGLYHKPGNFGNLPAGEVDTAPNLSSANGILVINKMGKYGENIKMKIEDGVAVEIGGSDKLISEIDLLGDRARVIAEIGIGTNPKAKVIGNVLEDEKVLGTVHIALGNNVSYGGRNNVPFHVDGIVLKPTLIADNEILIKDGKWLI